MPSIRTILIYLGLALLLTQLHGYQINKPRATKRLGRHAHILRHTGDAPWGYRVLVPEVAEQLRFAQAGPLPKNVKRRDPAQRDALSHPLERSYLLLRFVFTFGVFVLFHRWLRFFVSHTEAFAGTTLLAALHGPSYSHYWFQPSTSLDFLLWTAAAVATSKQRDGWLPVILLVGALNRETSVFIVLIYVALRLGSLPWKDVLLRAVGLGMLWLVPTVGVRSWVGELPWAGHGSTPLDYLSKNLDRPLWLLYAASFFGVLWVAPLLALPRLPASLKRLLLVAVPYIALQFLFGRVRELRLFLPLALVLIPAGLIWLQADRT